MKTISKINKEYFSFLQELKGRVQKARLNAFRSVNKVMIQLYWDIGKSIAERQKKHGWGKKIVEKLAHDLRKDFAGQSGFSTQNLWYMRQFFLTYKDHPILQRLVGELPWGQNLQILAKTKTMAEKEFYLRETIRQG